MVKKTSKKNENIIDLGFEDYVEENGFSDIISGTPVSSFSFTNTSTEPVTFNSKPSLAAETNLIDNRVGKPCANGIIPPVNNEYFDINRTYTFRKSTVRKLNELKAMHPDVNAYLSSILDEAINHYYDCITKENDFNKLYS